MTNPAMGPLADLCTRSCPTEAAACAFTLLSLTGGYFEAIQLDSPVETVIPQDRFLASPRARVMALRRAALARTETDMPLGTQAELSEVSACAADLIWAERRAYGDLYPH